MARSWRVRVFSGRFAAVRGVADLPLRFADLHQVGLKSLPKLRTGVRFSSPAPIALLSGVFLGLITPSWRAYGAFLAASSFHVSVHVSATARYYDRIRTSNPRLAYAGRRLACIRASTGTWIST
jgi:hypothetical protein